MLPFLQFTFSSLPEFETAKSEHKHNPIKNPSGKYSKFAEGKKFRILGIICRAARLKYTTNRDFESRKFAIPKSDTDAVY